MGLNILKIVKNIGFSILTITLIYYQIIKGDYYYDRARNNYIKIVKTFPIRGSIYDINNNLLAYDRASFNIAILPVEIKDRDGFFREFSRETGISYTTIRKYYIRNFKNIFTPVDILENIPVGKAVMIKEKFPSVIINSKPQRYYPFPYEFSHILGYVKKAEYFYPNLKKYGYETMERAGFTGLEQYYDSYLKGEIGGELIEVNAQGRIVGYLGEKKPVRGKDIYLTIDSRMQRLAYNLLKKYGAGTIIMMDSLSGKIKVLVSFPSYNLNKFISGNIQKNILASKERPLINRAIQHTYPLGSVVKPILAAKALDEEIIFPQTVFNCTGKFKLGDTIFLCWNVHNFENVYEAIVHSCNIFFYNLGLRSGIDRISIWFKEFGLSSPTGIDLPYEKKGIVPDRRWKRRVKHRSWFAGDTVNISIGQGYLSVTPLEALIAMNVFASGGYLVQPKLLDHIEGLSGVAGEKKYIEISSRSLNIVKEALRGVVKEKDGTAHLLSRLGLRLAGKTGTAQAGKKRPHGWFVGFFPYDRARYTVCVFLENAGSSHKAVELLYDFLKELKEKGWLDDNKEHKN